MYNILVVDDEMRIRSIIKKYAEFEGHSVTEAADGMEAVHFCRSADFDIIIMDKDYRKEMPHEPRISATDTQKAKKKLV